MLVYDVESTMKIELTREQPHRQNKDTNLTMLCVTIGAMIDASFQHEVTEAKESRQESG